MRWLQSRLRAYCGCVAQGQWLTLDGLLVETATKRKQRVMMRCLLLMCSGNGIVGMEIADGDLCAALGIVFCTAKHLDFREVVLYARPP